MTTRHKLTILVACYNEEQSIIAMLDRVIATNLEYNIEKEIIIIDDASSDSTPMLVEAYLTKNKDYPVHLYRQGKNQGKGACLKIGIAKATGNIIITQDADLEYDPADYNRMLKPILEGHADVIYGSRFMGSEPHRVLFFFHFAGNKFLTFLSNLFTQLNLTDMETGYKMFTTDILRRINLIENRFGFEPEVTAKISRIKGIRIFEIGISYFGRTFEEGKKINWRDGIRAVYCIFKYNLFRRK